MTAMNSNSATAQPTVPDKSSAAKLGTNGARPEKALWRRRSLTLALGLLTALILINAFLQNGFFKPSVMTLNLTTFLALMMIAVGQCYVVMGGSIDLSLGAIVSLVNVIVVTAVEAMGGGGAAVLVGMLLGLAAGSVCGILNGVLIAAFRLQAIVTTFATSIVFGGLALIVLPQAGGALPAVYYTTFAGWFFGLPFVLFIFFALLTAIWWMERSRFHIHLLAMGGNRQGAYQTGLSVPRLRIASHGLAGFMAAAAALCILGVTGAGDPLMGQAFTLGSVSAVVLGGIALSGGWGSAFGAVIGAAVLGLINNVIFFANINYVYQSIVQGVIILLALAAGIFVSRKPG
jgi:ribose transport system permease protein